MEFGKRLRDCRINKGYTQKELSRMVGVSEVTVSNWERGTKSPTLPALISISNALGESLDALAGTSLRVAQDIILSQTEKSFLTKYRRLDIFGKKAVEAFCDIELSRADEMIAEQDSAYGAAHISMGGERSRYIPAYMTPSAAGISVPLEGDEFEMILADSTVPADADFAVRIQGDSMLPYIADGAMVFVNKSAKICNGDVGIFCVDGAMYCKQFFKDREGNVFLLSANPDRTDANIYLNADCGSEFRSNGKVIMESIPLPEYFHI